jgi:hypothetical protein
VKGNANFPGGREGGRGGFCLPGSEGEHVLPLNHDPGAAQLLDDGQDLGEVLHLGRRSLHKFVFYSNVQYLLLRMFRITINTLFEKLFAGVLAIHRGGQGKIIGRDMSVSGPLVEDGDDLGQVSLYYEKKKRIGRVKCPWIWM